MKRMAADGAEAELGIFFFFFSVKRKNLTAEPTRFVFFFFSCCCSPQTRSRSNVTYATRDASHTYSLTHSVSHQHHHIRRGTKGGGEEDRRGEEGRDTFKHFFHSKTDKLLFCFKRATRSIYQHFNSMQHRVDRHIYLSSKTKMTQCLKCV